MKTKIKKQWIIKDKESIEFITDSSMSCPDTLNSLTSIRSKKTGLLVANFSENPFNI